MNAAVDNHPLHASLDGGLLIEASAGTGKTYALTTLVARLLVEASLGIDQLLVVTFTIAATGELRDRVRRTLTAALARLQDGDIDGDDQSASLVRRWQELELPAGEAARKLEQAVREFDRANVMTIHSFCQRALTEFAFDGALPFGFEVSGDDRPEVAAAVRDYWRRHMTRAHPGLLEYALDAGFTADALAQWTADHHGRPHLDVRGAPDLEADFMHRFGEAHDRWREGVDAAATAWSTHGDAFHEALGAMRWLKGSRDKVMRSLQELRAALASGGTQRLSFDTAAYLAPTSLAKALTKRPHQPLPDSPMLDHLTVLGETADDVVGLGGHWLRVQRRLILAETRERLSRRARKERRLGFDGLLTELETALSGASGSLLAARIRERYPRALIDEFQDTDSVQARVFRHIYGGASGDAALTVVGDPKQSIYRFRGADIFAYLQAAHSLDKGALRLSHNYRSTPALVRAVNAIFAGESPFLLPEIPFAATEAATDRSGDLELRHGQDPTPMQVRLFPAAGDRPRRKDEMRELAAADAAAEIAALLDGGGCLEGRPLRGSDIAVLVRNGAQGTAMAQALRRWDVQSVEMDDASVFWSDEATYLHRLLDALVDGRAARLRGALAGDLFNLDLAALAALNEDDRVWATWHRRFADWRILWRRSGVAALVRHLLFDGDIGGARHLLDAPEGARRMTNMLHLADLLREAEARDRLAPGATVEWLGRQREAAADETAQLRLESDEDLVRVVTMHRSKGLEFPIVFCPFAWYRFPQTRSNEAITAEYHDRKDAGFPAVLNLDPAPEEVRAERVEDQADELRLLYVALTRAQYRCVVTWAQVRDAQHAPLAWLLHPREFAPDTEPAEAFRLAANRVARLSARDWVAEVEALARDHPDEIAAAIVDPTPRPDKARQRAEPAQYRARILSRSLRRVRQMTSYSALAAQAGAAATASEHDEVESADHDQMAEQAEPEARVARPQAREPTGVFAFPRGPRAGDCLHAILEEIAAPGADAAQACTTALRRWRIASRWHPAALEMVDHARSSRLAEPGDIAAFSINDLDRPIPEMEFRLPAIRLDRLRLGQCLTDHGYPQPLGDADGPRVDGYLTGFIDLVARHRERWYVIDYKSNWLGNDIEDYASRSLDAAMRHHGYHLQYLLYLTALHRLLKLRLPDYDYDRHMGGACYLFLRGMRPARPGHGVFRDRPPRGCIEAIDACFAGLRHDWVPATRPAARCGPAGGDRPPLRPPDARTRRQPGGRAHRRRRQRPASFGTRLPSARRLRRTKRGRDRRLAGGCRCGTGSGGRQRR